MFSRKENSKTVGIFEGKDKKVFVHCSTDIIIDHSLEVSDDGEWCVYCLTKKGDLYRVGKDQADQSVRKSSRYESEQIEIFSDLLGQGDSNDEMQLTLSSQAIYILNEGDIVQRHLEDPIRLCVSIKHTVVLAKRAKEYVVHLFEKTGKGTCSGERIARMPKKCSETMNNSFCEVLIKVVICPCICNSESACPCDLRVDTRLFKQLFGEEAALLNSPVVLICMGDGSVYFMRMSSFDSRGSVDSSTLIEGNNSWTLLCHMQSCVKEVAVVNVPDNKVDSYATALCVCCKDGQVTIFQSERIHLECNVWDVFITSPVDSICSFRNRLYYISGHSLFESTVAMHHESIKSPRSTQLHISQTKVLGENYLAKIHTASADRYVDSQDSPCLLHCSCQNGEVKLIETSLLMDSKTESSLFFKDSLKHLLTSIDCVDEKRHKLKIERKMHEKALEQISIASYLMAVYKDQQRQRFNNTGSMNTEDRNGVNEPSLSEVLPLLVQVRPNARTHVESELTEISVEVTNQMPVVLSRDWTLSASLYNTVDGSVCVSTAVKNESNWKQQEKKILSLPVTFDDILVGCKLLVKATIIIDGLGSEILSDKGTDDSVCVSCPLYEGNIDVLDCLLPSPMKTDLDDLVPQSTSKLNSHIRKQAFDRNPRLRRLSVKSGIDDVTVHTRHKIRYSLSKTEGKISEAEFKLLREVHGSIPVDINNIRPSSYKLFTPVGHSIHFSLSPADGTDEEKYGEVVHNSFEVTVRSAPRIVAAVNRAIRHREKRIISAIGNHVTPEIKTNCAKKAIHVAQEVLNQLRCQQADKATLTLALQNLRNIQL